MTCSPSRNQNNNYNQGDDRRLLPSSSSSINDAEQEEEQEISSDRDGSYALNAFLQQQRGRLPQLFPLSPHDLRSFSSSSSTSLDDYYVDNIHQRPSSLADIIDQALEIINDDFVEETFLSPRYTSSRLGKRGSHHPRGNNGKPGGHAPQ
jgi:hypothetical protein